MTQKQQTQRDEMLEALRQQLVPMMKSRGFSNRQPSPQKRASAEWRRAFPLGDFERRDGENLQLVEVQVDINGAPRFVLNVGVAPPEGVTLPWGFFEQSDLSVSSLTNAFRLYSAPRWQRWFGPGVLTFGRARRAGNSVKDAMSVFHEIEEWFIAGTVGKHMRRFGRPADERA